MGIISLDLVIANAAVADDMTLFASLSPDSLARHFRVNTIGPMLLFQATLPLIPNGGKFVFVSTLMAMAGDPMYHGAGQDAYRLTKVNIQLCAAIVR
jgi:norsolorinic acid ketoreductase